ncbi:MAG: hypothetical protein M3Q69_06295 [Acidobacteriota bacterium]|nr:hypothetical protein [Acidobacteriota bacterium]
MHALLAVALLASIDLASAQRALTELEAMCAADRGRMWGRSLCGPMVIADPNTREAVQMADGHITETHVPESIGIANTAVQWDGREWTMLQWPLPQSVVARRVMLAHESFHRVQEKLGFPATGPLNAHLDTAEGRTLLRLEWRALARALATGDARAVADALAFRAERRMLTKNAAQEERLLEMHEGLAEHTGWAMAIPVLKERIAPLVIRLANAEKGESFVRSFAYTSGPAWGAIAEMQKRNWTRTLEPSDDLADVASRGWFFTGERFHEYGAAAIRAEEEARAAKKATMLAEMRKRFVDDPVLTIPLQQMQLVFDPNRLQPLEGAGTVYQSIEISDAWGKIAVTNGGLVTSDWKKLIVPASGEGWTLTLAPGWKLVDGPRAGDKSVDKE